MKDNEAFERLLEARWRGRLDSGQEAELRRLVAAFPGLGPVWELEEGVIRTIEGMPDAPVPGNFTARVLSQIELEDRAASRRRISWPERLRAWAPRLGLTCAALVLAVFSYSQFQAQQRAVVVENIPTMAKLVAMPGPEALRDFDAIRALERAPAPDLELLRLLE